MRWRAIPGWLGYYEVSDAGCVRSLDRAVSWRNRYGQMQTHRLRGRQLRPGLGALGYPHVVLSRRGRKPAHRYVHDLVLTAFVGPKPKDHDACHYNGDKTDCRLANLRYGTRAANILDSFRQGRLGRKRGRYHSLAKG